MQFNKPQFCATVGAVLVGNCTDAARSWRSSAASRWRSSTKVRMTLADWHWQVDPRPALGARRLNHSERLRLSLEFGYTRLII
jgi:hypothetical protein